MSVTVLIPYLESGSYILKTAESIQKQKKTDTAQIGMLVADASAEQNAKEKLAAFPNVSVYDFSAREEWVLDLRNYKDTTHYGQWINDAITDCIASGDGRVESRADLDEATARLAAWADAQIEAGGWIW